MAEELNLVDHGDRIAKHAFRALLNDASPLTIAALAEHVDSDEDVVRQVLKRPGI